MLFGSAGGRLVVRRSRHWSRGPVLSCREGLKEQEPMALAVDVVSYVVQFGDVVKPLILLFMYEMRATCDLGCVVGSKHSKNPVYKVKSLAVANYLFNNLRRLFIVAARIKH